MATDKQVAIVTGAASGLGRAMTLGLLTAGIEVAGVDRNTDGLAGVAEAARERQARGALHAIGADLADPEAFDRIVANALGRFGRIDVLVNNAGIGQSGVRADQRRNPIRFWEATPEQMVALPRGERHGADHVGPCRAATHAVAESGPNHHRDH
jgi:3-oxoacyl-[acyl-carrier protein] reductase